MTIDQLRDMAHEAVRAIEPRGASESFREIARSYLLGLLRRVDAEADRLAEAERPRGTMACPICGADRPHSHEPSEIQKWVKDQAARFGYKAIAYVPPATTDDFVSQTVQSLRGERANGNKPGSTYELGSYPDSLIEDAIEAIELLQADSRPADEVTKSERNYFHASYIDKARECASLKARLTEAEREVKRVTKLYVDLFTEHVLPNLSEGEQPKGMFDESARLAADGKPIEVHLNTRDCEPMTPETMGALGRVFKAAYNQMATTDGGAASDEKRPGNSSASFTKAPKMPDTKEPLPPLWVAFGLDPFAESLVILGCATTMEEATKRTERATEEGAQYTVVFNVMAVDFRDVMMAWLMHYKVPKHEAKELILKFFQSLKGMLEVALKESEANDG